MSNKPAIMLTTKDNPFNPFTHYEEWEAYDLSHGYCCNAYIARMASYSLDLTDAEIEEASEQAIMLIVAEDVTDIYEIVSESTEENTK